MNQYYTKRLSAERLEHCYEIAPPRVKRYLDAEIDFVLERVGPEDLVLELGCGYGRVMNKLTQKARWVVGIDTSVNSLVYGRTCMPSASESSLVAMDAQQLGFRDHVFDVVVCIQNGISAFHVDQELLIRESVRVAKTGGTLLFSSYSNKFWDHRLEWFRKQSKAGLMGDIDDAKTKDGVITCKDGFTATTVGRDLFLALASRVGVSAQVVEVDESSLFCEMVSGTSAL